MAIEQGLDAGHFFGYSLAHYYAFGVHRVGETGVWDEFLENRSRFGFDRAAAAQEGQVLGAQLLEQGMGALRGAIGTPAQISDLIRRYEAAGVDQLIFVSQAGRNLHEDICASMELFAREVLPEFAERADEVDRAKEEKLAGTKAAALARRQPARTLAEPFVVPSLPAS